MSANPTAPSNTDPYVDFKAAQRVGWASFGPLAMFTTPAAARLVRFAGVRPGQRVLDVACGTGVVAVTAARLGARVTGADFTPELLAQARESSSIAELNVDWNDADVEQLPFADQEFDVVLSQFGHMFAPRPAVAVAEMLRVLKPGGTIAFTTWPAESLVGRTMALTMRYLPPPPQGVAPPLQWGDPAIVRERLGAAVRDLTFDRDTMVAYTLSPQHQRWTNERTAGPTLKLVQTLAATDPAKLAEFRREFDAIVGDFFEMNTTRQTYLMTRSVKV